MDFNPRTREGCDAGLPSAKYMGAIISIHAPVKGATVLRCVLIDCSVISIHAPVKGATRIGCIMSSPPAIFQSTHP